jgi:hypothetical protein
MSRTKQVARRAKAKRADETASNSGEERAAKKAKTAQKRAGASGALAAAGAAESGKKVAACDVISRLLGGLAVDEFLREHFEKKPLLVRAKEDVQASRAPCAVFW